MRFLEFLVPSGLDFEKHPAAIPWLCPMVGHPSIVKWSCKHWELTVTLYFSMVDSDFSTPQALPSVGSIRTLCRGFWTSLCYPSTPEWDSDIDHDSGVWNTEEKPLYRPGDPEELLFLHPFSCQYHPGIWETGRQRASLSLVCVLIPHKRKHHHKEPGEWGKRWFSN